jgi:hypothetical protein
VRARRDFRGRLWKNRKELRHRKKLSFEWRKSNADAL